ncbi:aspartyl-phosphate phosphatase Spo0E family protein [Paenibacillus sp. JTLBN-2024]|jgi:hypothetical protein|uniref:Aspartyl-phosphate phosphatase Spo0E family protein n=1 Tax=Paenibacillus cookii TaxID=157839 RepID=A0ABQ4LXJ5_9BACL|nr:aspartyl-phosphate phosphatase Spo0E family protein [Paenibacillus cookii]KHF36603.1 Spo0E like sporulation regulatory protein [Paenibacillus sp. P1XP2]GIO67989.1 hypothetical protein J21TS3_28100 [Paenibacillus cookii]HWO54343.1 aspartyl-phosphate phosphatase Spo0E family protein [Paenibacillus cookii]
MNSTESTQISIEEARQRLYHMVDQYGEVWNPKVIRQSMVLDELINCYNRAMKDKRAEKPIA